MEPSAGTSGPTPGRARRTETTGRTCRGPVACRRERCRPSPHTHGPGAVLVEDVGGRPWHRGGAIPSTGPGMVDGPPDTRDGHMWMALPVQEESDDDSSPDPDAPVVPLAPTDSPSPLSASTPPTVSAPPAASAPTPSRVRRQHVPAGDELDATVAPRAPRPEETTRRPKGPSTPTFIWPRTTPPTWGWDKGLGSRGPPLSESRGRDRTMGDCS